MLVLPLHQPHGLSSLEVGRVIQQIQPVLASGLPFVPGLIIPISTLRQIATHNHLEQKLHGLLTRQLSEEQVADFFSRLQLPAEIGRELLKSTHQIIESSAACIYPSWVSSQPLPTMFSQPVKGDAVILEEFLIQWGRATWVAAQMHIPQPWLSAAPIVQRHTVSPLRVEIYTISPSGNKTAEVTVVSAKRQPAISDHYQIDVRTMQITHRLLDEPHHPLLSDIQVHELTEKTYQVKRNVLGHLHCSWELFDKTWVVQKCESLEEQEIDYHTNNNTPVRDPSAIVTGKTAVSGVAEARAYVTTSADQLPTSWNTPIILITPQLGRLHPSQLKQIVGIVCGRTPDRHTFDLLHQLHIPTLVEAKYATRLITSDQVIHLDATQGIVKRQPTPNHQTAEAHPLAIITWWLDSNEPHTADHLNDGAVLSTALLKKTSHLPGAHLRPLSQSPVTWVSLEWSPTRHSSQLAEGLQTLARAERFWPTKPHLITPGLHAPLEAKQFLHHMEKSDLGLHWPLWWKIETPENILNASEYLDMLQPRGLVVDIQHLAYQATGIQFWDHSVAAMYPFPTVLLESILAPLAELASKQTVPLYWHLPQPTSALIELAILQKVAGVMVNPYYVAESHRLLSERANRQALALWQ